MLDAVRTSVQVVMDQNAMITQLMGVLKEFRGKLTGRADPQRCLSDMTECRRLDYSKAKKAASLSEPEQRMSQLLIAAMQEECALITGVPDGKTAFETIKKDFDKRVAALRKDASDTSAKLSHMFDFAEIVFGEGQELLIITTELTANKDTASYISKFGCKEYFRHNKDLLLYERQGEIQQALKELKLN